MSNRIKSNRMQQKKSTHIANSCLYKKYWLSPIMLIVLLVPLLVHESEVNTNLSQYEFFSKTSKITDIFVKIKADIFITLCIITIICMLFYVLYSNIRRKTSNTTTHKKAWNNNYVHNNESSRITTRLKSISCLIPLVIYMLLVVVSTIHSEHTRYALRGTIEQYESLWVLLGYGLTTIYLCMFLGEIEQIEYILKAFIVTTVVIIAIGLSQLFGHDFFQTKIGHALISRKALSFKFEKGRVYATLYNPNYVGVFVASVFPIIIGLLLACKQWKRRIFYSCIAISLIIIIYGSKSKSGTIGLIISLFLMAILFMLKNRIVLKKYCKHITIGIIAFIAIVSIGNLMMGNPIKESLIKTKAILTNHDGSGKTNLNLSQITTNRDNVYIRYRNEGLKIQFYRKNSSYTFTFVDDNDLRLEYTILEDGKYVVINDQRFSDIRFSIVNFGGKVCFNMYVDNHSWYFTSHTDGTYYFVNQYGRLIHIDQTKQYKSGWNFGSGRGYIWDRSLRLLKEHMLLGTGPDTFVLYFPNTEYLNLYHSNFISSTNGIQTITKPHNLYLQIATQTGLLSLIAFIVFYIMYGISSVRLYLRKSCKADESTIGIAILCSTVGYMVSGLANDSTIAVSCLFWILIGLGLGINQIIKKNS